MHISQTGKPPCLPHFLSFPHPLDTSLPDFAKASQKYMNTANFGIAKFWKSKKSSSNDTMAEENLGNCLADKANVIRKATGNNYQNIFDER